MSESPSWIRRILVPLDLNRLSEGKIPPCEAQARAFGAEIILLHVIPQGEQPGDGVTQEESLAVSYLQAISARLRSDGFPSRWLVGHGPVADTIIDEIERQEVDLVVIGSSVRHGFARLLGSIAEDVLATAPCPVLVVRPNLADAEKARPVRSFDDDAARWGPLGPATLGIRTVEVARIVGSVGRAAQLDEEFRVRPSSKIERERYERILAAMKEGIGLPPVALYKLGYGYYVLDGNHRVAAARQLGQLEIEAEVTEFVPLDDAQSQRVFAERRAFERATGLTRVGAEQPGSYVQIEDAIRRFAQEQGIESFRDAARAWEEQVYRQVAGHIRRLQLRDHLPGQRTADIFVQLSLARNADSERAGRQITWEEALDRFHAQISAR